MFMSEPRSAADIASEAQGWAELCDFESALKTLDQLPEADAKHHGALSVRTQVAVGQHNYADAVTYARELQAVDPQSVFAHIAESHALGKLGFEADSITVLYRAVKQFEGNPWPVVAVASEHAEKGQCKLAYGWLMAAIINDKTATVANHIRLYPVLATLYERFKNRLAVGLKCE